MAHTAGRTTVWHVAATTARLCAKALIGAALRTGAGSGTLGSSISSSLDYEPFILGAGYVSASHHCQRHNQDYDLETPKNSFHVNSPPQLNRVCIRNTSLHSSACEQARCFNAIEIPEPHSLPFYADSAATLSISYITPGATRSEERRVGNER